MTYDFSRFFKPQLNVISSPEFSPCVGWCVERCEGCLSSSCLVVRTTSLDQRGRQLTCQAGAGFVQGRLREGRHKQSGKKSLLCEPGFLCRSGCKPGFLGRSGHPVAQEPSSSPLVALRVLHTKGFVLGENCERKHKQHG